jgi:hypothetical protein
MIDIERAKSIILDASSDDETRNACKVALDESVTVEATGSLPVHEALRIYRIKASSAKSAGIDVRGVDQTLTRLQEQDRSGTVVLFAFENAIRHFIMFILESDESFIGCMSVPRRPHRVAPPDWDGVSEFWLKKEKASAPQVSDIREVIVKMDVEKKPS